MSAVVDAAKQLKSVLDASAITKAPVCRAKSPSQSAPLERLSRYSGGNDAAVELGGVPGRPSRDQP
jgi:hypothetical protein